jgi:hypothetical protein
MLANAVPFGAMAILSPTLTVTPATTPAVTIKFRAGRCRYGDIADDGLVILNKDASGDALQLRIDIGHVNPASTFANV